MSQALDEIKIGGLGASRKRVEDNRFTRGKGNYTDDITLPGMLHLEILRSPLAHARIKSIDTSKAWEIPGVHLVLTGEMMATRNLAWMPTLSYDTQAVLATDKVRFQGQEVACVIADDRRTVGDGLHRIHDHRQLLVLNVDRLARVLGDVRVVGDHAGHFLALEPHLVGGQDGLGVVGERRHPRQVAGGHHLAGEHEAHSGYLPRPARVDRLDPRVRHRAAQDLHVQHAGQHDVVGVVALAPDETVVLDALAAGAQSANLDLVQCLRHVVTSCLD